MKVVHVLPDASIVTGGGTYAAYRIHEALLQAGVDSIIVTPHDAAYPGSVLAPRRGIYCVIHFLSKCLLKILEGGWGNTGLVPSACWKTINGLNPDFVIIHYLTFDVMAVAQLRRIKAPIYWYHHDLWPLRGLTAYEWYKVPSKLIWLDRRVRLNKEKVIQSLKKHITPVCASEWVANQIRQSQVWRGFDPVVIPLVLNKCFGIGQRISGKRFRVLFGARGGFVVGIKGGDRLLAALDLLPENVRNNTELMVFGEKEASFSLKGIKVCNLGRLTGGTLAQAYRDADVFAFPSRQETFGQTKIEALACGTPVVAFNETACAEGIIHKVNGWVAESDDIRGFADGIIYFYQCWKSGKAIRVEEADEKYSAEAVANCWIKRFNEDL